MCIWSRRRKIQTRAHSIHICMIQPHIDSPQPRRQRQRSSKGLNFLSIPNTWESIHESIPSRKRKGPQKVENWINGIFKSSESFLCVAPQAWCSPLWGWSLWIQIWFPFSHSQILCEVGGLCMEGSWGSVGSYLEDGQTSCKQQGQALIFGYLMFNIWYLIHGRRPN